MWQRIKTAVILIIIVGLAMFANSSLLFLSLLMVGTLIASYEWAKMMPNHTHLAGFVLFVLAMALFGLLVPTLWIVWWSISVFIWILATKWVKDYPNKTVWYGQWLLLMGAVILTASITAMYALWQISTWLLLYVFLLVWCADSGAYFVGRKLGRRKLAPNVSPNKSIEGLFGGLVIAGALAIAVGVVLQLHGVLLILFFVLSGLTVLSSVLGDLFESMLKRRKGIKDSGTFLPGHGGILDRIDSLLSAVPVFALGLWLLNMLGFSLNFALFD